METVVLTIRPINVAIIALMVAVILCLYYVAVRGGVAANKAVGGGA